MSASEIIEAARSQGVTIALRSPDSLLLRGQREAIEAVKPMVAGAKAQIVAELCREVQPARLVRNATAVEVADRIERALAGDVDPEREAEMRERWALHDRACRCADLTQHFGEGGSFDGWTRRVQEQR